MNSKRRRLSPSLIYPIKASRHTLYPYIRVTSSSAIFPLYRQFGKTMFKLTMGQWLMFGLLVAILTCGWTLPAPDVSNRGIADALKALEKLDRYYSHVAMPRFGKRTESVYENSDYDGPVAQSLKDWLASSAGR